MYVDKLLCDTSRLASNEIVHYLLRLILSYYGDINVLSSLPVLI